MKKAIFIIMFVIVLSNLIIGSDKETYIACGGDEELMIMCSVGDAETSFFSYQPEPDVVGSRRSSTAAVSQSFLGKTFDFDETQIVVIIVSLLVLVLFFIVLIVYLLKIRKK